MKRIVGSTICSFLLLLLPGCGRIADWGTDLFYQGCNVHHHLQDAQDYIRSVTILDELQTVGMFDALWLNDIVVKTYVDSYAQRTCMSPDERADMLAMHYRKIDNQYKFYILTLNKYPLGDPYFDWVVHLVINDSCYAPLEIKKVNLAPEYVSIFGYLLTKSKTVYEVTFDPQDLQKNRLVPANNCLSLQFKSVKKVATIDWDMNESYDNNQHRLHHGFYY